MSEMKLVKCPYCGSVDGIHESHNHYKCSYCDCEFFVSSEEEERILTEAHNYLVRYKFDDADDLYRQLSRQAMDKGNMEIYTMAQWGRLLAYFGVVYVRSFNGKVSIPTFAKYDGRFESVTKCDYFFNIMDSDATDEIKEKYIKMANSLDETYTKIKVQLKETPEYDVFICVKTSLTTEKYPDIEGVTKDSKRADNIYYELIKRGLRVFYSDKSCVGVEYDSQILSALTKSKMLLVISSSTEYLESAWVQSEWRRWLNFIKWEEKEKNSMILLIPNYDTGVELPSILTKKKIQYFDDSIKVINHICNNINKIKKDKELQIIDELEKANKLYDNKKYDEALLIYKDLADKNVAEAQYKLGVCYEYGIGVEENLEQAFRYYKLAADQGDLNALNNVGFCYEYGIGVEKNPEQVFKYYKLAADQGDLYALYNLGYCYEWGEGVEENSEQAFKYYKLAADQGDLNAQYSVGSCYELGDGVEENLEQAIKYYKLSADQGNFIAQFEVGEYYAYGYGVEKDLYQAFKYFKLAADQGDFNAQLYIGEFYKSGYGVEKDLYQAFRYYKLAADQGLIDALYNVGVCYEFGDGVEENKEQAFKYYRIVAHHGEGDEEQKKLADCYYNGIGVSKDINKAIEIIKKTASKVVEI